MCRALQLYITLVHVQNNTYMYNLCTMCFTRLSMALLIPQQLLREIQSVARDLQSELIKRGDYTPDLLHKNRSLSTTCTELLHLSSVEVPSYTCQQVSRHSLTRMLFS